jgi:hypothetical protein
MMLLLTESWPLRPGKTELMRDLGRDWAQHGDLVCARVYWKVVVRLVLILWVPTARVVSVTIDEWTKSDVKVIELDQARLFGRSLPVSTCVGLEKAPLGRIDLFMSSYN